MKVFEASIYAIANANPAFSLSERGMLWECQRATTGGLSMDSTILRFHLSILHHPNDVAMMYHHVANASTILSVRSKRTRRPDYMLLMVVAAQLVQGDH